MQQITYSALQHSQVPHGGYLIFWFNNQTKFQFPDVGKICFIIVQPSDAFSLVTYKASTFKEKILFVKKINILILIF